MQVAHESIVQVSVVNFHSSQSNLTLLDESSSRRRNNRCASYKAPQRKHNSQHEDLHRVD